MATLSRHARRLRVALVLASLVAMLATPAAALADRDDGDDQGQPGRLTCPGRETLVSIDDAICPANPHRPVIVRHRKCCKNPAGQVHCDHFPHCPPTSPS
jgi:hypothetical protein